MVANNEKNFNVLAYGKFQFGPDTLDNVVTWIRAAEATLHLTEGFDAPSPYTIYQWPLKEED